MKLPEKSENRSFTSAMSSASQRESELLSHQSSQKTRTTGSCITVCTLTHMHRLTLDFVFALSLITVCHSLQHTRTHSVVEEKTFFFTSSSLSCTVVFWTGSQAVETNGAIRLINNHRQIKAEAIALFYSRLC